MTEAQKRRKKALEEQLKELRKIEKADRQQERNKAKSDDRTCMRLFGLTVKQIQERLSRDTTNYDVEEAHKQYRSMLSKYKSLQQEYDALNNLVTRLMDALPRRPDSFEVYVEHYENRKVDA